MQYGEVLKSAWNTIWKHKVLWVFGILASLGTGGGGGSSSGGSSYQFDGSDNGSGFPFNPEFGNQIERWFELNMWIIPLIILAAIVLILIAIVLGTFGRIGLARGAWLVDEGKSRLTFGELFAASSPYFWRVILLSILIFAMWMGLALALFIPVILTAGIALICLIPFICLLVPISWAAGIIVEQATVSIVGDDLDVIEGLKKGWEVFRAHIGESLIMGLVLGVGKWVADLIIAIPVILMVLPMIGGVIMNNADALRSGLTVTIVLICLYTPVALALSGIVQSYVGSAWVITYRRLTGRMPAGALPVEVEPAA